MGGFVSGLLLGIMVVPPVSRMNRKKMICLWMIRFIALGGLISLFIIMSTRFYAADEPDEVILFFKSIYSHIYIIIIN